MHRIGRTGRAGRKGTAIMISVPSDDKLLAAIESLIETTIPRVEAPWQPGAAPEGPAAEDKGAPEKPARRSRGRSKKSEAKPSEPAAPAPEAQEPAPRDAPKPRNEDAAKPEPRSKPAPRNKPGRRNDRGQSQVVGMGDHLPSSSRSALPSVAAGRPAATQDTDEGAENAAKDDNENAA